MIFCSACGYKLNSTDETYCPKCGEILISPDRNNGDKLGSLNTNSSEGDIIGTALTGQNNITAKDIAGNVIYLNIDNITSEQLKNLITYSPALSASSLSSEENVNSDTMNFNKAVETKQRTVQVLESINKVEKITGIKIQEIIEGDLQISKKELTLREIVAKGNEHYYKNEYYDSVKWYDTGLKLDDNNVDLWINKGITLHKLEKFQDAIVNFDKAILLKPNAGEIWYYKGLSYDGMGLYDKSADCYNKAKELDSSYSNSLLTPSDVKIVTDEPVIKGVLDFNIYSKLLSNIIQGSNPRFTVGIFGGWGTGKTTMMLMIQNILEKNENIVTVWFDAWRYEKEQNMTIIPFLRTVKLKIDGLNNHKKNKWEIVKKGVIRSAVAFIASTKISYGIKDIVSAETDFSNITATLKGDGSIENDKDIVYYHATDFLKQSLKSLRNKEQACRLVIFIDDLDRCSPEKALEVLESIKSLFDIEGIVYVIGMNYNSIDNLVREKYGEKTNDTINGFDYIKKIVQLPFQIPDWIEIDISKFIDNIIFKDLNESILAKDLYTNKKIIMRSVDWNPREVKRFINNIILSKAVFDKPVSNLIVVQALKFRPEWRKFLDFLTPKERKNMFLQAYKDDQITSSKFSICLDKSEDEKIKRDLLKACPDFFEQNSTLRNFLDSGAVDVLLEIENMEEVQASTKSIRIKSALLTTN